MFLTANSPQVLPAALVRDLTAYFVKRSCPPYISLHFRMPPFRARCPRESRGPRCLFAGAAWQS